jgi:predicted metal-dependent hydrolase
MSTTTIEDQLEEVRGRIDRLRELGQADGADDRARVRRHIAVLRKEEASVRDAVRHAPDEVEEKLGELRTRLYVAEHSVAADLADDWTSFAVAVEAELRRWDDYLERLQTSVAAKAWKARARTEAAIRDVRSRRLEVDERLAQARGTSNGATESAWRRVSAARDDLEQKADELSARLM